MRLRRPHIALLMAAVLTLPLGGCGKKSEQTDAEKAQVKGGGGLLVEVSAEQQAASQTAVKTAYAAVQSKVKTHGKTPQQKIFAQDVAVLTRNPNRLAGLENGSLPAAEFVKHRLQAIGLKEVATQSFPVVQPVYSECKLVVDGKDYEIFPVRPNNIQASVTPAEGLSGETLYAGSGETPEYGKQNPKGRIVVLDFDCGDNWRKAFAFGAKAVVFVGPKDPNIPAAQAYQHINVPANLPRFYVSGDLAEKLQLTQKPRKVKLLAACQWKQFRGQNVIGVLRGTNPRFDQGEDEEETD